MVWTTIERSGGRKLIEVARGIYYTKYNFPRPYLDSYSLFRLISTRLAPIICYGRPLLNEMICLWALCRIVCPTVLHDSPYMILHDELGVAKLGSWGPFTIGHFKYNTEA